MKVLVTRPREDAERTAARLQSHGHEVFIAPLLDIRFRTGAQISLEEVQAILVTSANGIRALAARTPRRDLPVFTVGPQSAEAARVLGFADVKSADGDAAALAEVVKSWARPGDGALFHARGTETRGRLAEALTAAGFTVRSEVLYEAVAANALSAPTHEVLRAGAIEGILLYSPRTARLFRDVVAKAGLDAACSTIDALCISAATAAALGDLPFRSVRVADTPNEAGMLALLG